MKMKKVLTWLLAGAMAFGLTGCGNTSDKNAPAEEQTTDDKEATADNTDASGKKQKFKVGVSIMELTAYTWYQGVVDGCKQWLEENGDSKNVSLDFTFEDSRSDVQTMLTNLDNMQAAGCEGIILFPADASSAIPTMKESVNNNIPVVIGDFAQETQSEDDKVWSTFVGHDMKKLGQKAGEKAVEYLDTLGKDEPVCLFITRPTSGQVSQDRFDGFKEAVLAKYPNAKIVEEGDTGAGNRDSAQTLMENVLQRETVIDVVSGHNDAEVVGAYNAAVAQGRNELKFIGIAGDIDVLGWIQEGNEAWLGEVLQDPVVLGYQATDAMMKVLLDKEELPDEYDLPEPEVITSDNIKDYDWKNWAWLG